MATLSSPTIYLRDTNQNLAFFWHKYFKHIPEVRVSTGNIFDLQAQAIISPANSFGFMDGGIDLIYRDVFGKALEDSVQTKIRSEFHGELPIGMATSVPIFSDTAFKYLIVAPTMRVPLPMDNTTAAYSAFRAALLEAKRLGVSSVACPGLGTGTGRMCVEMVARQMFVAYLDIIQDRRAKGTLENIYKHHCWMMRCSQDEKKAKEILNEKENH